MAISIPIITEFVGDGISTARQEFAQLEGVGKKAQYAIKKAAVPAAAADEEG
jgi:endonuclease III